MANGTRTRPGGLFGAALMMAAGMALAPVPTNPGPSDTRQQRGGVQQPAPKPQPADEQGKIFADFTARVKAYVALHQKLEGSLPRLPTEATPKQIDDRQRKLAAAIQSARATAKQGEIFTPAMTAYVKRLLARVFGGADGKQLRASIMDENVKPISIKVNQPYPDEFPLTTMPPEVLQALPQLPEELEYRFLSEQLILLDPHAHVIADFIVDALPGK